MDQLPVIQVTHLTKEYRLGANIVHALRGVSLSIYRGELVAIMGPSGSGKTTFMNLVGCLDRPTSGEYLLAGQQVSQMSRDELALVRNHQISFIFQSFNLLPRATALSNVMLPLVYAGISKAQRNEIGRQALAMVGLEDRATHKPSEMSGGQQQRVAIARALVNSPSIIMADEPTGNLDSRTSIEIMSILQSLNASGITIVLVTHEADIAAYTQRNVIFKDGRVISDTIYQAPRNAQEELARLSPLEENGEVA